MARNEEQEERERSFTDVFIYFPSLKSLFIYSLLYLNSNTRGEPTVASQSPPTPTHTKKN